MLHGKHLFRALIAASLLVPSVSLLALPTPPPQTHHEMPKPTNLKVLPKNISSKDLMATMHQFTGSLGVHCSFCHVEDKTTHHLNFASDAKPEKRSARVMIRMTKNIDGKYLAQLPDHGDMQKVGCGTCHRGHSTPTEFVPPPEEHGPPASSTCKITANEPPTGQKPSAPCPASGTWVSTSPRFVIGAIGVKPSRSHLEQICRWCGGRQPQIPFGNDKQGLGRLYTNCYFVLNRLPRAHS